jgi:formylglycine-generating enzyme required for sulfatase activity
VSENSTLIPPFWNGRESRIHLRIFGSSIRGRYLISMVVLLMLVACLMGVNLAAAAGPEETAMKAGQLFRDCSDCPEMVVIPAGGFLMGSSSAAATRDLEAAAQYGHREFIQEDLQLERPQHSVTIGRSFALSKNFVTRGEFGVFVRETGYLNQAGCTLFVDHTYPTRSETDWQNPGFAQTDRDPVVCVSWEDAKAYVDWLNNRLSHQVPAQGGWYRLPSEAEWEYAARAGTQTTRWWGDAIGQGNANCDGCGSSWDKKQTAPVGSFAANPFGISDALGNAWEWTEDCWNDSYVGAPEDGRAWITGQCDLRVMRGGDWNTYPWVLRSAERSEEKQDRHTNYIGFRIAKSLQK